MSGVKKLAEVRGARGGRRGRRAGCALGLAEG
jgi:hypothetical protein